MATAVLVSLGVAAILVGAWSLVHGGIGWDSAGDTRALLVVRSIDSSASLAEAYEQAPNNLEFYGVFLQQFADLLHTLATGSTTPLAADDPVTYLYQGAATLILAVAAVTALAAAIVVACRSLLAGAFAWSLSLATPLWLGMSHVNFKDVPAAAGVTLVTAGVILSCAIASRRHASMAGVLVAGSGGVIAIATRPGSLFLLVVLLAGSATIIVGRSIGRRRFREALPILLTSCSAVLCGLLFTFATNPIARINLVSWLKDTAQANHPNTWEGTIRTAGQDVLSTDLPWWYVPAWVGAQLPVLTSAALVAGLIVLGVTLLRRDLRVDAAALIVPIALQAIVIPAAIVVAGAVLYDGIRHLLFLLPPLLVIPAVALAALERRPRERRWWSLAAPMAAAIVVLASLIDTIRWAPYAYAYVNPIAANDRSSRSWELDYWGVSAREGIRRLRQEGATSIYVMPSPTVGIPYGASEGRLRHGPNVGLYVFLRWNENAAAYGCKTIFRIERGGHVLGEGARCPAD